MPKKKPPVKKFYYIEFTIPIYNVDVIAIVGAQSRTDILNVLKREKVSDWLFDHWKTTPHVPWLLKASAGSTKPEGELAIVYLFQAWEDTHHHRRILVHEISHIVDDIAKHKNFEDETEARAYLTDFLYNEFVKRLSKR